MIVFGHYAITTRTIKPNELPYNFQVPAGAQIQKIVRVAHIFWIPLFPFETLWGLRQNGQLHKLNPDIARQFDQSFGPVQIPWYAFAGPILVVAAILFFRVNNTLEHQKSQKYEEAANNRKYAEALSSIDTPQQNDYFLFKTADGYVPGKMHREGADSLTLLLGEEQQYEIYPEALVNYFANPNALSWSHTLAKSELKKCCNVGNVQANAEPVFVSGALQNKPLQITALHRVDPAKYEIRYKDEAIALEVHKTVKKFIDKQTDTEVTFNMLDSASHAYFREMLQTAKSGDFTAMKAFTDKYDNALVNYKNMIYTHFVYLDGGKKSGNTKSDMKDYAFFLKLLNLGLWRLDFEKSNKFAANARLGETWCSGPATAKIVVNMDADQLNMPESIPFEVVLHKEKGNWKINLLSTYSYTTYQLRRGLPNMSRGKEYRKMVRDEIQKVDADMVIGPEWEY